MSFADIIHAARESRDYARLGQAIPYMDALGLRYIRITE